MLPSPKARLSAAPAESQRRWPVLAALLLLAACQAAPPPAQGTWTILPADKARLTLALADLPDKAEHLLYRSADHRYVEETAHWERSGAASPRAGLRLSEATPGPPLTDPKEPAQIVPGWATLQDQRPAFAEPESSRNALGPISWWRASFSTSVCVVFVQRLAPRDSTAATLSGFYCNPPGTPLSPQGAETVVQSIGLRPPPSAQ